MSERFVLEQSRARQYDLQEWLGDGGFASVYKVMNRDTNTVYALKTVKLNGAIDVRRGPGGLQVPVDDIEVKLMECLQKTTSSTTGFIHPNIIELKDHWKQDSDTTLCMVLEFCGAPLSDGIEQGKYQGDIDRILENLTSALHYCEQQHVLHLDIKPDNVLIRNTSTGNIYKLADFGLSHFRDHKLASLGSGVGGTDQFKAPETTGRKKYISSKADVWATGLTLHWVVYRRFAFKDGGRFMNLMEISELLSDEPDFLTIPPSLEGISQKTTDAINRMLVVKVDHRASPSELAESLGLIHAVSFPQKPVGHVSIVEMGDAIWAAALHALSAPPHQHHPHWQGTRIVQRGQGRTLSMQKSVEASSISYNGVFFNVVNKTADDVVITGLEAGAYGGVQRATLWVCGRGTCEGNEGEEAAWWAVWTGNLMYRKTTQVSLEERVVVKAGAALGFLLHCKKDGVCYSDKGEAAEDSVLKVEPWYWTSSKLPFGPHQPCENGLRTPAGAISYAIGA